MTSTVTMDILLKYGWMVPMDIPTVRRHMILTDGTVQSRNMREKVLLILSPERHILQTVCCSEQEQRQPSAGSETRMDLQMIQHGQNPLSVMDRFIMIQARMRVIIKEMPETDFPMDMKRETSGRCRKPMPELHRGGSGEMPRSLRERLHSFQRCISGLSDITQRFF